MSERGWMPDGQGLGDLRELIQSLDERVHLRLTPADGGYPRTCCQVGLGEWWTGLADEVNCPACLEWVHG